jgi:hypothetical protein
MADQLNFNLPPQGFDSYLAGILPENLGVAAGAFSTSMQQVKNIDTVDIQTFAKTVYSLETNNGLPLTNGTNVPTDAFITDAALRKVALGSGLYGTYTHSDFIGSMTALPYPLQDIYNGIKELQTDTLINIYKEIWELCTYSRAIINITFSQLDEFNNPLPPEEFRITGASVLYPGGGYDPNSPPLLNQEQIQPTPQIGTLTVGSDPNDPATYKRITGVTLLPAYQDAIITGALIPRVVPDPPPDAYGDIDDSGAWAARQARINELIIEADAEIQNILTSSSENFAKAKLLNANWYQLGTSLKIEQRARYTAIPPVPIPRDPWLALYPTALYNFVDALPTLAANTMPHGPAQSLEMLSDFCSVGGQSLVGMMRQERNQERLAEIGITLDNNIPNTMSPEDQRQILANGTKCGATQDTVDDDGNIIPGAGIQADNGLSFTMPAFAATENCDNQILSPVKTTVYDNEEGALRKFQDSKPGTIAPLLENPPCNAIAGPTIPIGESVLLGTGIPSITDDETANVVPILLNIDFISGTLLPSQYDVPEAIDNVIECNCDCWIQ